MCFSVPEIHISNREITNIKFCKSIVIVIFFRVFHRFLKYPKKPLKTCHVILKF